MNSSTLLLAALILLGVGAVITVFIARYRTLCGYVAFVVVLVSSVWISLVSWTALTTGPVTVPLNFVTITAFNSSLEFVVNELSAIFLLLTAFIMTCASLFSIRYIQAPMYQRYSLTRYYPILLLFYISVISVLSVHNMLFFLCFWEFMTWTSYVLVVFHWVEPESSSAGLRYFIAAHVGTGCMVLATIILYSHAGMLDFSALRDTMAQLMVSSPVTAHTVIGLFVIGFATKAGILPFGFWIPAAYRAAPGAFSAVMAGCLEKLGVYGVLVVFMLLTPVSRHTTVWGVWIAVLGTASLFVATLTALQQTDSKHLLSFHSIGQVGYIWLGVGAGLALLRISPPLAVMALVAGLFHAINHGFFKSLLFCSASSAVYRTGVRDMDKMGGLMYIMPVTAVSAIVGSLSISGIPGFNGFVSKWLIFAGTIMGGLSIPSLVFMGIAAIFISAVTLASFVKFLGMVFLGKLEVGPEVERREVPVSMIIPQVALGIFCILFGVLPVVAIKPLYTAVSRMLPGNYAPTFASVFGSSPLTVNLSLTGTASGSWGPIVVLVAFAGCLALAYFIFRMGGAQTRTVPMWLCGEEHPFAEVRYPVHSFLLPFNRLFATIYPSIPMPRLPRPSTILRALNIDDWLYYPGLRLGERIIRVLRATHAGNSQLYMLWVIVGAALAIIVLFTM